MLVVVAVPEAHLEQLLAAAVNGLHLKRLCSAVSAHPGRPCSHTAPNPGHTATLAEAAGTRGYREWEVGRRTVDCVVVKKPMDPRRREDPSRGQCSP